MFQTWVVLDFYNNIKKIISKEKPEWKRKKNQIKIFIFSCSWSRRSGLLFRRLRMWRQIVFGRFSISEKIVFGFLTIAESLRSGQPVRNSQDRKRKSEIRETSPSQRSRSRFSKCKQRRSSRIADLLRVVPIRCCRGRRRGSRDAGLSRRKDFVANSVERLKD